METFVLDSQPHCMQTFKEEDSFIDPQEFVVGYSMAPGQLKAYMSFSHYDKHGARISHHTDCCIGAHRATHCATESCYERKNVCNMKNQLSYNVKTLMLHDVK